jgi:hypothetical protein
MHFAVTPLLTASVLLMLSISADALTVEQYKRFRGQSDTAESLTSYLGGLRDGLVSSSVAASSLGQKPHFCIPKGEKSISTQEFVRLLDASLNN